MEERLSIRDAAERLNVSPDTVRRRMKKGELVGEKEPTPQGYEWRIVLPVEESDAPTPESEPSSHQGDSIELDLLRERIDELKEERNAWKEQAQRSGEAERELRVLLRQSQELALPANTTRQEPSGATEEPSQIVEDLQEEKGLLARLWSAFRGGSGI